MLTVLDKAFPEQMKNGWQAKIKEIIPSYGLKLNESAELTNQIRRQTSEGLKLPYLDVPANLTPSAPKVESSASAPKTEPKSRSKNLNPEEQAL